METAIVIAGFGGQGVLFAGQLIAYAAMDSGLEVTWIPSYGPEMRGGTANCTVIVGDHAIGAPTVAHPDVAVVLNQPSFDKYKPLLKQGGLLVVNSSLISASSERTDIEIASVPANEVAEELGSVKMLNMAALGCMLARRPILTIESVSEALSRHLPASKQNLLEANVKVLRRGYEISATVHDRAR